MKINFEKLEKVECKYRQNNNLISLDALQTMMNIILHSDETGIKFGISYTLATTSLIELGILEILEKSSEKDPKVQQLNS